MNESIIKECLARCLDGLQEAYDSLEECSDVEFEINIFLDQIDNLYNKILHRYEK